VNASPTAKRMSRGGVARTPWAVALLAASWILCSPGTVCAQRADPYAELRSALVDNEIAREGITNTRVLESLRSVPRHQFVRPDQKPFAYFDQALEIGHKQTISPPFIVAYMTEVIDPQPTDRVLEIGTGSGYQAAVLSGLVQDVYTIEIVEPLGEKAARLLKKLGYENVHVRLGDGYLGWPEEAPFDKIIVTCSPESVPQPLIDQLKEGGRMIIPLGERYQQVFHLFVKQDGMLQETKLLPTLFVPMTGRSETQRAVLPDPRHPEIVNGGFEQSTLEPGKADNWYYQRRSTLVTEDAPEGGQYLQFENDVPGRGAHILQGMGIDGRAIGSVRVSLKMKLANLQAGPEENQRPGLTIHFFDARRMPIGAQQLGPWYNDQDEWSTEQASLPVPRGAQEAIVQVGLNGATGVLSLDDLRLIPEPRD
jgi:protein-L-isoaspartate(D-aspartate) O-methyltransferase